jgi:16S rRNA (guanine966-N2)-methyltransferase
MAKRLHKSDAIAGQRPSGPEVRAVVGVRIIGGRLRGRRLRYSGDPRTRPMKDRLREAIFNRIGPDLGGKHALDLFAGTGALAFEALSRGAGEATLIERHRPTANLIRQNVAALGVAESARVVAGDVFLWWKRQQKGQAADLGPAPAWVVFCSPPYDFYVQRAEEMLDLIVGLTEAAPAESIFVVEADDRFDFQRLPDPQAWNVRRYPPAVVGIFRKGLGIR